MNPLALLNHGQMAVAAINALSLGSDLTAAGTSLWGSVPFDVCQALRFQKLAPPSSSAAGSLWAVPLSFPQGLKGDEPSGVLLTMASDGRGKEYRRKTDFESPHYQRPIQRLKYGHSDERALAAKWLGETGNPFVVDALIDAFDGSWVDFDVIQALVKIGRSAVLRLIRALAHPHSWTREGAASALGDIGGTRAVEPLIGLLEDRNEGVRWAAVRALGKIGDRRAVNPLIRQLGVGSRDFQDSVRWALAEFGLKIPGPSR